MAESPATTLNAVSVLRTPGGGHIGGEMSFETVLGAYMLDNRQLILNKWTIPSHVARNKVRNNGIPVRYYAATKPLRLAS